MSDSSRDFTSDEVNDVAFEAVEDYLDDGIDFLSISERLEGDGTDEFTAAVYERANVILAKLAGMLYENDNEEEND